MRTFHVLRLLALGLLAGCWPDIPEDRLICEDESDCPRGFFCRAGEAGLRCVSRQPPDARADAGGAGGARLCGGGDPALCMDATVGLDAEAPTGACECSAGATKQVTRDCGTCTKGLEKGLATCDPSTCKWLPPTTWSGCTSPDECKPGDERACEDDCKNESCPVCGVRRCAPSTCKFDRCVPRVATEEGCFEDHWQCCGEGSNMWRWCNRTTCVFNPLSACEPCPGAECKAQCGRR